MGATRGDRERDNTREINNPDPGDPGREREREREGGEGARLGEREGARERESGCV